MKVALAFIALLAIVVLGVVGALVFREWRSPSGKIFVATAKGKVELVPAAELATVPGTPAVDLSNREPQAPTALAIPSIDLRAKVVLMTNQPPQIPAVGWLFGSSMPGSTGNLVLYGARAGANAIFQRLDQLHPGDRILVDGGDVAFVYQVDHLEQVPADRTDLLLPTDTPIITLLTDAGAWDPEANDYAERLVVRGHYVAAEPWDGSPGG